MDQYVDITDQAFEALREHESDQLIFNKDLADEELQGKTMEEMDQYKSLCEGDSLKLYHPSNPEEALRVQIDKKEESQTEIILHCSLLEWIFHIETELDEMLREEERLLREFF